MRNLVSFFEIPVIDFSRAVNFYENLLETKLSICECEEEKMAFFPEDSNVNGALSYAENFNPGKDGVLIHFNAVGQLDTILEKAFNNGGKIHTSETKIEAEGKGSFAIIIDSEGNKIGFYTD